MKLGAHDQKKIVLSYNKRLITNKLKNKTLYIERGVYTCSVAFVFKSFHITNEY